MSTKLSTHGFIINPELYKLLSFSHVMDEHHHPVFYEVIARLQNKCRLDNKNNIVLGMAYFIMIFLARNVVFVSSVNIGKVSH